MFFFNLVERKTRLFINKQEFLTLLHLRFFQAISEFVRGNMEPRCWKFGRIMLRSMFKQQK